MLKLLDLTVIIFVGVKLLCFVTNVIGFIFSPFLTGYDPTDCAKNMDNFGS